MPRRASGHPQWLLRPVLASPRGRWPARGSTSPSRSQVAEFQRGRSVHSARRPCKIVEQADQQEVCPRVIPANLGPVLLEFLAEGFLPVKIVVQSGEQILGLNTAYLKDEFLHRGERIGGICRTGAVNPQVIVFEPPGQVIPLFEAIVHKNRIIRCRRKE